MDNAYIMVTVSLESVEKVPLIGDLGFIFLCVAISIAAFSVIQKKANPT